MEKEIKNLCTSARNISMLITLHKNRTYRMLTAEIR
jgi:hypothetical protein